MHGGGHDRDRCPECEKAARERHEHHGPPPHHGKPGDKKPGDKDDKKDGDKKDDDRRSSSMMPGHGGPPAGFAPRFGGGFGGGPQQGFRRNWDNPPDEKKADEKKADDKKPAEKKPVDKKPAEKTEPAKKPEAAKKPAADKQPEPEKKPATTPKKEARSIDVEVLNSVRVAGHALVESFRPLVQMKLPRIDFSLIGSVLVDEDRPVPTPSARGEGPRPEGPRPDGKDGPHGPGFGFGGPDGRRHDGPGPVGPPHGGSSHSGGPGHSGMHSYGPWGHFDPERFKEADPELYAVWKEENDLEKKTFELGEQYRRTQDGGEKEKLKKELADQVGKHFDVRQKKRELELKRFAEHLERMKASIAKRQEAKESIVKERVGELTGEDDTKF